MARKVLVVTSSPRKNGNSSMLADAFIEGAQQAGNTVHRVDVGHAKINGCLDCKHCFTHEGVCIQKDDMQDIYPLLRECDVLVIASPIYFFTLNAQIKAFIDRMFCMIGKPFAVKSTVLLTVQEDKDQTVADNAVNTYKAMTSYIKWEDLGIISVAGVNDKGAIEGNPKLDEARALGASIG